jgi:tetratricopeptide (TPR) repeat protein
MFNKHHKQGSEAFDRGRYLDAKHFLLLAIGVNPETPESYFLLGKACFLYDEQNEALVYLKKYIELKGDDLEDVANVSYAFDLLGQCYGGSNTAKALKCYKTATQINPSCASAWHNRGLLYIKSAQYFLEKNRKRAVSLFAVALFSLKNALDLGGDNPMFFQGVASWYEQYIEALTGETTEIVTGHFKLALEYYRKALSACHEQDVGLKNIIIENFAECLAQCGHHLYKNQDYPRAQILYLEALTLDPDHLIVLNQIGMSLVKQNKHLDARQYFLTILEKTEDKQEHADAWLNIACTYRLEKNWVEAEKALDKAKKLAPQDESIREEEATLITLKTYSDSANAIYSEGFKKSNNSTFWQSIKPLAHKESHFINARFG